MNRNSIIFFIGFALVIVFILISTYFLISSVILFFIGSLYGFLYLLSGSLLLFASLMLIIFLIEIKIPPHHGRERLRKEERRVISLFYLLQWMSVLFLGTILIYLAINIGSHVNPEFQKQFDDYITIAFASAVGALWGAGMTEVLKFGSFSKYGKKYETHIDWVHEIEPDRDWYPNRKSYDENLRYIKENMILYTVILSLLFFVLMPEINKFLNKFFPI